jgi:hypothetical protein
MASVREVKAHDAVMSVEDGRVSVEVGGRSRKSLKMLAFVLTMIILGLTLNIDTPLLRVKTEGLEGSPLTESLSLINVLIATVVSCSGVALGVLVLHNTA